MQADISICGYTLQPLPIHKLSQGRDTLLYSLLIYRLLLVKMKQTYGSCLHISHCCFQLKVDIDENPAVAAAENVRIVPTFKIYKNGSRVKEIVCPSRDMLEQSVRHYNSM